MVDLTERLSVLLKQEKSFYKTHDYLSPAFQEKLQSTGWGDVPKLTISSASTVSSTSSSGINELWREKICEWSYQVVDHFDFSREVVSISMSFLDRYLCTRPVDKKLFQLAAMTTLYLAIKLNEPGTLSMQSMIELSRGYFKVEQMAVMEMVILQSLSWHVHPPTSISFARLLLHMLPASAAPGATSCHGILEMARFMTELSVIDYFFVTKRTSSIGLASLLNAMDYLHLGHFIPDFLSQLRCLQNFDPYVDEVDECRLRLNELYCQGGQPQSQAQPVKNTPHPQDFRNDAVSPVCVTAFGKQPGFQRNSADFTSFTQHQHTN